MELKGIQPTPWEEMTPTERAIQRRRLDLIVDRALRDPPIELETP